MQSDAFEWDDAKNARNTAKHGVSFERARLVFADAFAVGGFDDRAGYGEDRFFLIGSADGAVLFVAYAERDDRIRVISARRATRHEQDNYYRQDGRAH